MYEIWLAMIIASVAAGSGLFVRCIWKNCVKHHKHHMQLDTYPEMFKQHTNEHKEIKQSLNWGTASNIAQHRTQLMTIYDKAIAENFISRHWYYQFCELYTLYIQMGGNGPVSQMKKDLDNLVAMQGDLE